MNARALFRIPVAGAVGAALVLVACAAAPPDAAPTPSAAAPAGTDASDAAGPPAEVSATPSAAMPAAAVPAPSEPEVRTAAVPPEPAPPAPAVLRGLSGEQLTRLLGAPHFRRVDDPGALWQYRGEGCILDVFLYADGPVYRVTHFEFRRPDGRTAAEADAAATGHGDPERCFAALVGAGGRG